MDLVVQLSLRLLILIVHAQIKLCTNFTRSSRRVLLRRFAHTFESSSTPSGASDDLRLTVGCASSRGAARQRLQRDKTFKVQRD
eukprot:2649337-Pleurochrysis_carterae.AAC.1